MCPFLQWNRPVEKVGAKDLTRRAVNRCSPPGIPGIRNNEKSRCSESCLARHLLSGGSDADNSLIGAGHFCWPGGQIGLDDSGASRIEGGIRNGSLCCFFISDRRDAVYDPGATRRVAPLIDLYISGMNAAKVAPS